MKIATYQQWRDLQYSTYIARRPTLDGRILHRRYAQFVQKMRSLEELED